MNQILFVLSNGSEPCFVFTSFEKAKEIGINYNCDFLDEIILDEIKNQVIKTWKFNYENKEWCMFS